MRRFICISMLFLFLVTIVTGFAEAHVHPGEGGIHIVISVLFVISTLTHVVLNRKAVARHLVGQMKKAE